MCSLLDWLFVGLVRVGARVADVIFLQWVCLFLQCLYNIRQMCGSCAFQYVLRCAIFLIALHITLGCMVTVLVQHRSAVASAEQGCRAVSHPDAIWACPLRQSIVVNCTAPQRSSSVAQRRLASGDCPHSVLDCDADSILGLCDALLSVCYRCRCSNSVLQAQVQQQCDKWFLSIGWQVNFTALCVISALSASRDAATTPVAAAACSRQLNIHTAHTCQLSQSHKAHTVPALHNAAVARKNISQSLRLRHQQLLKLQGCRCRSASNYNKAKFYH